jgi:hypothetical protein
MIPIWVLAKSSLVVSTVAMIAIITHSFRICFTICMYTVCYGCLLFIRFNVLSSINFFTDLRLLRVCRDDFNWISLTRSICLRARRLCDLISELLCRVFFKVKAYAKFIWLSLVWSIFLRVFKSFHKLYCIWQFVLQSH